MNEEIYLINNNTPMGPMGRFSSYEEIPKKFHRFHPSFENANIPQQEISECIEAVKSLNQDKITLVDWGGADGKICDILRKTFPDIQFDFHIVETEKSIKLFSEKYKDRGTYHRYIEDIKVPYDVFLCNAALTFAKDPFSILRCVKSVKPKVVLIQRTWDTDEENSYLKLHVFIPNICPAWVISQKDMDSILLPEYKMIYVRPSLQMQKYGNVFFRNRLYERID